VNDSAKKYFPVPSAPRLRATTAKYTKEIIFCSTEAAVIYAVFFATEFCFICFVISTEVERSVEDKNVSINNLRNDLSTVFKNSLCTYFTSIEIKNQNKKTPLTWDFVFYSMYTVSCS